MPAVQRHLAGLRLGQSLWRVRRIYPERRRKWASLMEPKVGVERIFIDRYNARRLPPFVEQLRLGFRHGFLVEIQMIATKNYSRSHSVEAEAGKLSQIYGPPSRSADVFWWRDGKTVLRLFSQPFPLGRGARLGPWSKIEMRTSFQVLDEDVFRGNAAPAF